MLKTGTLSRFPTVVLAGLCLAASSCRAPEPKPSEAAKPALSTRFVVHGSRDALAPFERWRDAALHFVNEVLRLHGEETGARESGKLVGDVTRLLDSQTQPQALAGIVSRHPEGGGAIRVELMRLPLEPGRPPRALLQIDMHASRDGDLLGVVCTIEAGANHSGMLEVHIVEADVQAAIVVDRSPTFSIVSPSLQQALQELGTDLYAPLAQKLRALEAREP